MRFLLCMVVLFLCGCGRGKENEKFDTIDKSRFSVEFHRGFEDRVVYRTSRIYVIRDEKTNQEWMCIVSSNGVTVTPIRQWEDGR